MRANVSGRWPSIVVCRTTIVAAVRQLLAAIAICRGRNARRPAGRSRVGFERPFVRILFRGDRSTLSKARRLTSGSFFRFTTARFAVCCTRPRELARSRRNPAVGFLTLRVPSRTCASNPITLIWRHVRSKLFYLYFLKTKEKSRKAC